METFGLAPDQTYRAGTLLMWKLPDGKNADFAQEGNLLTVKDIHKPPGNLRDASVDIRIIFTEKDVESSRDSTVPLLLLLKWKCLGDLRFKLSDPPSGTSSTRCNKPHALV